jgi:molybdopterin molybdotransferase
VQLHRDAHPVIYFGLPGNPVSALVSCWRFVQPAINKLAGLPQSTWTPTWLNAIATQDLKSSGDRESYLWGKVELINGEYHFALSGGTHSSGNLINLAGTNALGVITTGTNLISAGEKMRVLAIG